MTITEFFDMIHARRRYHLRRLMTEDETAKDMAARLGMHHTYFSGLLAGKRPFCEKRARKIEQEYGLAFGSLDKEVA